MQIFFFLRGKTYSCSVCLDVFYPACMQVEIGDTSSPMISRILCLNDWEIHQLQQKFSTKPESRELLIRMFQGELLQWLMTSW